MWCDCAQWGMFGAQRFSSRRLPFLNDDDDGTQQKDEDHQASGTHPEDQTHLLRVLGHLQGLAVIFAGR